MEEQNVSTNPSKDECNMGMLAHLIALVGILIPFGSILGPLVIWLVKRDQSTFVDAHGKEAINFNITVAIAGFVSALLMAVLIGFVMILVVLVFWLVCLIKASMAASRGEMYSYPFTLRLLK